MTPKSDLDRDIKAGELPRIVKVQPVVWVLGLVAINDSVKYQEEDNVNQAQ